MAFFGLFPRKQWQRRQEDGSWLNVSDNKAPGVYRFITIRKGVPTISPIKEVRHGS